MNDARKSYYSLFESGVTSLYREKYPQLWLIRKPFPNRFIPLVKDEIFLFLFQVSASPIIGCFLGLFGSKPSL